MYPELTELLDALTGPVTDTAHPAGGARISTGMRTVTFYWDGRRVYSQPFPVDAGHPEYLIFDYQMFANGIPPPPRGATMLVDWARAWRVG